MNNKIYPFKFLDSYTAEDKDIFFGRDEEVDQLYQMIYQSDILLLYGASGTGKTSLIQCGLASKFQKHDWLEVFVRRHKNLNESLQKSLITVGGQNKSSKESAEKLDWLDDIMEEGQETNVLTKKLSQTQAYLKNIYLKHFRPIYLIFDQFEELFILGTKAEQAEFIGTVQEILKVEQPVKLIFSIREEYLGSLYEFERAVPELFRKKLRIDPMNLEKVKNVVLGATGSKKSIVHINKEEAETIAEQVFEKIRGEEKTLTIQLPYLQVFLDKFYRHISKDKSKNPTTEATFTLAALSEIGDIGDILRDFLDEQIVEIAKAKKCTGKTIWKILSPFVTIDGTKEPTGINTLAQNFPEIQKDLIEQVVTALMNNRILRYIEEEELYEIAHDSLALRIAEKRSDDDVALLEVRNLIKSQSLLKDEARELFSEKQLDFISPFLKRLNLNSEESKLIEESREEVLHAQKEALRKKRGIQIAVSIFVLALLIMLVYAWGKKMEAETAKDEAETAKDEAEIAKDKAEIAKEKNEKIISAMDFYDGKYALAFKNGRYGFIDKEGNEHPKIDFIYDKGEPFDLETGFAEMEIEKEHLNGEKESIKYLVDTSGNKYRLVYVAEVLKNRSNVESTLSKEDIRWLRKKLGKNRQQKIILDKLEEISDGIELEIKTLMSILNQDGAKLALDFSGLMQADIVTVLKKIIAEDVTKDKVELMFFKGSGLDTLPELISKFQNLKECNLNWTKVTRLPSSFSNLIALTKLDLSVTDISELPKSIGNLKKLKNLSLPLSLKELPESIFELGELEVLDFSEMEMEKLSSKIGNLKKLRSLNLPMGLEELPESIFELKELEVLNLFGVGIKELSSNIGNLKKLRDLSLPMGLEELPERVYDLRELEVLDLAVTDINKLPENIGNLKEVRTLSLPEGLKELPENIYDLKKLEELDLSETKVKKLSVKVANLKKLRTLRLPIDLEELPEEIYDLKELEVLNLSKLEIKELSAKIGNLKKLRTLKLPRELEEIPEEVFGLKELELLDLSKIKAKELSENIGDLEKLKDLSLPKGLEELPEGIYALRALTALDLSGTKLKAFPANISKLKNLEYLDLSETKIKELPKNISNLINLNTLNLIKTEIKELPATIFDLKNLEGINLAGTKIKELPKNISNLINLRYLILSETEIKELPATIFDLKNLEDLDFSGTKIKTLPENIANITKLYSLSLPSSLEEFPDLTKLNTLYYFSYTLDENDTSTKSKIETLQKKFPNCFFDIIDKDGNPIELSNNNN